MYEFTILTVFPFTVILAASLDLVSMKIPNRISIFLVYAFLILFPFATPSLDRFGWHVAAAAIVFIPTFILWAMRMLGAGDVKFLSAIALWVGWDHLLAYVVMAGVCGGILSIAILAFRAMPLPLKLIQQPWIFTLYKPRGKIPYGIALAAGALLVYPNTMWVTRIAA